MTRVPVPFGPNVFGAVVFFGYIAAAILLSCVVLRSIFNSSLSRNAQLRNFKDTSAKRKQSGEVKRLYIEKGQRIMFPLALASFTVLSWNMLYFLITSYKRWAAYHDTGFTFREAVRSPFGTGHDIWAWATSSTLFQAFAEDLLIDDTRAMGVRAALLYSFGSSMWMATTGYELQVPDTWAYFLLSQILPMSFAQNLFCCATLLRQHEPRRQARPLAKTRYILTGCYVALLFYIDQTIRTVWFFPALFSIRLILFAPYLIDNAFDTSQSLEAGVSVPGPAWLTIQRCLTGLATCTVLPLIASGGIRTATKLADGTNYAAAALVNDMVLGIASALVYAITKTR